MNESIVLAFWGAKQTLTDTVNDLLKYLPAFAVENLLYNALMQVRSVDEAQYAQALKAQMKKGGSDNGG